VPFFDEFFQIAFLYASRANIRTWQFLNYGKGSSLADADGAADLRAERVDAGLRSSLKNQGNLEMEFIPRQVAGRANLSRNLRWS
jgi:hypothetical protein